MQIDVFKNGTSSYITDHKSLTEVFHIIQHGDHNLDTITELRRIGKSSVFFAELKLKLPSFRFNFNFTGKASNATLKGATGLIYIDVDRMSDVLDKHNLIHASWKSISTTGYSILVRIDGLTLENYPDNYNAVSEALGLSTDVGARKATQQTILSFDPNLYHNPDSIVFKAISKKVSSTVIQGEERRLITLDDTFFRESDKLRFSNISDYFDTDDTRDFITFDEKEKICMPYIPNRIETGKRNQTMFFVLSQYALLNPRCGAQLLISLAEVINQRFIEKYTPEKISSIVGAVLTKRENKTITPWMNKERKIIFNPAAKLTKQEKQKIVGGQMGKAKTEKTLQAINRAIEDWNVDSDGKITQKKVAEKIGMSVVTIKRNWEPFKSFVSELNADQKPDVLAVQTAAVTAVENEQESTTSQETVWRIIQKVRAGKFSSALMQEYILKHYQDWDEEKLREYYEVLCEGAA